MARSREGDFSKFSDLVAQEWDLNSEKQGLQPSAEPLARAQVRRWEGSHTITLSGQNSEQCCFILMVFNFTDIQVWLLISFSFKIKVL